MCIREFLPWRRRQRWWRKVICYHGKGPSSGKTKAKQQRPYLDPNNTRHVQLHNNLNNINHGDPNVSIMVGHMQQG